MLHPHVGAASRHHLRGRVLWDAYHWYALAALFLLATALGISGFRDHFHAVGEHRSPTDLFYLTLQLFTLKSGDISPPVPWTLDVARFLAPAVALSAVLQALAAVFREQFQALRTRLWSGHVVVCGLGEKGLLLAESFRERGDRVLAIERDPHSANVAVCRRQGIPVVAGDAAMEPVLGRGQVGRARYLVAVCGEDQTNAEVATGARALSRRPRSGTLTALVHLLDPDLCSLLAESQLVGPGEDQFRLEFFNVFERSVSAWLSEHPPFADGGNHLVVVGGDRLGEALLTGAVREWFSARPAAAGAPRVTLVDSEAGRRAELIRLRYPALSTFCELDACELEVGSAEFIRASFLADASMVYVCLPDEKQAIRATLALARVLRGRQVPVVLGVQRAGGLVQLIGAEDNIRVHSLLDRTCTAALLVGQTRNEIIARAMHDEYVHKQAEDGQTSASNASMVSWEQLPESLRESNRRQADHVGVKLRLIGCGLAPLDDWQAPPLELTETEVEQLAKIEHDRWVAERTLDGWTFSPGPKDIERKTTPWLIPWHELPEEQRAYDRNTVRNLPRFLTRAGVRVYRLGEDPAS